MNNKYLIFHQHASVRKMSAHDGCCFLRQQVAEESQFSALSYTLEVTTGCLSLGWRYYPTHHRGWFSACLCFIMPAAHPRNVVSCRGPVLRWKSPLHFSITVLHQLMRKWKSHKRRGNYSGLSTGFTLVSKCLRCLGVSFLSFYK